MWIKNLNIKTKKNVLADKRRISNGKASEQIQQKKPCETFSETYRLTKTGNKMS